MSKPNTNLLIPAFCCILVSLFCLSCQTTTKNNYNQQIVDTGKPALHAVHSQQLRQIMRELKRLAMDRLPQEMDLHDAHQQQIAKLTNAALKISNTARHIPDALPEIKMSEENQKVFAGLAEKLRIQALDLYQRSQKGKLSDPSNALRELTPTCNACHSLFRNMKNP